MRYDPIMCMTVNDSVKTNDAGGFAPGSKAKITVENERTQYETYAVEYDGQPLKRGFKTREAAKNYAKSQGLTTDSAIDKAIRSCDAEDPKMILKQKEKVIEDLKKMAKKRDELKKMMEKLNDDHKKAESDYADEVRKLMKTGKNSYESEKIVDTTQVGRKYHDIDKKRMDVIREHSNIKYDIDKLMVEANKLNSKLPKEMQKFDWGV